MTPAWRTRLFGTFSARRLLRSAVVIYGLLVAYLYVREEPMLFLPQPSSYKDGPESIKLQTPDGKRITAFYAANPHARYTLLYSHGNAEDIGENPTRGRHELEQDFELSAEQLLDIVKRQNRLAVAMRGGVAEHHLGLMLAKDPAVQAAGELLLDVRGALHHRAGRPLDRLVQQEQAALADVLGFADADELLRAVSDAGRTISFGWESARQRIETAPRGKVQRRPLADGVVAHGGEVALARDTRPGSDPALLLRVAETLEPNSSSKVLLTSAIFTSSMTCCGPLTRSMLMTRLPSAWDAARFNA